MNKWFCIIGFLSLCSCADTELIDSYKAETIPDGGISTGFISHKKHDFLGVGYDATESYLSDEAVKLPVIDLKKIPEDRIEVWNASSEYSVFYTGATSVDYIKNISTTNDVDPFGDTEEAAGDLFSGTILNSSQFGAAYSHSSQYSFASCDNIVNRKRFLINAHIETLQQCLLPTFTESLATLSAEQFIDAYGTHVLMDVCTGGYLRGLYRSIVMADKADQKAQITQVGLISSINKIGFFPGFTSSNVTEKNIAKNVAGKLAVEFHGGNMNVSSISIPETISIWAKSLDDDNAVLTNIAWNRSLPIYELISDPIKKEQIKETIIRRIVQKKIAMSHTAPMFQSWNGSNHLYSTSYNPVYGEGYNWAFEYPVCTVYRDQVSSTIPLYVYSNGKNHLFTLDYHPEGINSEWVYQDIFGYVYADPTVGAIPLYQAYNGNDYCYTTEPGPTYGIYGSWKNEGIVCYVLPLIEQSIEK